MFLLRKHKLPPPSDWDHKIILKEGAKPVTLRPYRHNSFHKDIIEKMVKEMLDSGVIRPNNNLYFGLLFLV